MIVSILLIQPVTLWANNEAPKTLLVLGDSLSAAYGIEQNQGWVHLVSEELKKQNIQIINASISGETTSGGKQRINKLFQQHQPNWMILELGANDALRGQNLRNTKQNLQSMISLCEKQQCETLLLGIRLPTNYGPAYDRALQRVFSSLAKKNQLLFDPFFLEEVATDPDLMQADALHPNAAAQVEIKKRLMPLIKQLIQ